MSNFNPKIKFNKKDYADISILYKNIIKGDRFALAKSITLIESEIPEHKEKSKKLINLCLKEKKNTLRIGISGSPGVGKSTLLESLGIYIIEHGKKPAVLTIDPSSKHTSGSILGDKTRMNILSSSKDAFIRPSPAGNRLGGVAKKTRESIFLTEAAGYNPIFVETVGVGQSEVAVHSMTDLFILLIQPGGGDEIQGIKRGIMEMADIILINKADKNNITNAKITFNQYTNIIDFIGEKESGWKTKVLMISALENNGIDELWSIIKEYEIHINNSGYYDKNREIQNLNWFEDYLFKNLISYFKNQPKLNKLFSDIESKVENGDLSVYQAGDYLLNEFIKHT